MSWSMVVLDRGRQQAILTMSSSSSSSDVLECTETNVEAVLSLLENEVNITPFSQDLLDTLPSIPWEMELDEGLEGLAEAEEKKIWTLPTNREDPLFYLIHHDHRPPCHVAVGLLSIVDEGPCHLWYHH